MVKCADVEMYEANLYYLLTLDRTKGPRSVSVLATRVTNNGVDVGGLNNGGSIYEYFYQLLATRVTNNGVDVDGLNNASSSLLQKHIDSKSISNNMLPKAVMKGSRSNATKESINEDNSLSEMVKNVKYHSTLANLKSILGQGGTSIYLL
ncbi:hypothetical protein Tco_1381963 [Tanacetum coccineum]